jgi:hypothetical protein
MKYLIYADALDAEARSRAAWVARTGTSIDPSTGTVRLWGVVEHPSSGQAAIEILDNDPYAYLLTEDEAAAMLDQIPTGWDDDAPA